jgi:hypothetical protein
MLARRDAAARFERIAHESFLDAVERELQHCFRSRLASVVGHLPDRLVLDDDLHNAVVLSAAIVTNRRLLLDLLRAWAWDDREWRERQPANAAFLERLAAAGVDRATWLGAHPRRYGVDGARGGFVRIALETDAVAVLQMGNYFDTCLAVESFNAFSTVANACDLNKRVIYARDGAGRVVGRKLIAVNEDGRLVGYCTYAGLHDEAANVALGRALCDYARRFAALCGLALADEGAIPLLLAVDWYDDGAEAWEEAAPARYDSPHESRVVRAKGTRA